MTDEFVYSISVLYYQKNSKNSFIKRHILMQTTYKLKRILDSNKRRRELSNDIDLLCFVFQNIFNSFIICEHFSEYIPHFFSFPRFSLTFFDCALYLRASKKNRRRVVYRKTFFEGLKAICEYTFFWDKLLIILCLKYYLEKYISPDMSEVRIR